MMGAVAGGSGVVGNSPQGPIHHNYVNYAQPHQQQHQQQQSHTQNYLQQQQPQLPPHPHQYRPPWDQIQQVGTTATATGNPVGTTVGTLLQQPTTPAPQASHHHNQVQNTAALPPSQPPPLMLDINQVPISLNLRRGEPIWASICNYPAQPPPQPRLAPCHLHSVYTRPFATQAACNSHTTQFTSNAGAFAAAAGAPLQITQTAPQQIAVAAAAAAAQQQQHQSQQAAALVAATVAAAANYQHQRTDAAAAAAVAGLSLDPHQSTTSATTAAHAQLQPTPITINSMTTTAASAHHLHSAAAAAAEAAAAAAALSGPHQIIISAEVSFQVSYYWTFYLNSLCFFSIHYSYKTEANIPSTPATHYTLLAGYTPSQYNPSCFVSANTGSTSASTFTNTSDRRHKSRIFIKLFVSLILSFFKQISKKREAKILITIFL